MPTPETTHPFRDSSAGVNAKRDKLLGARRADLAFMSHSIRRTYVSRCARIGGSVAFIIGGLLLLVTSLSAETAELASTLLPGEAPAPLSNLLFGAWIGAALGALLGRSIAERRFTTAMTRAVLPSDDAHRDVARLAGETPDDVGRRMAHKIGRIGRALPIVAAGLILPATAMAGLLAFEASGYPSLDRLESMLTSAPELLVGFAALATLFGAVLYYRPRRAASALVGLSLLSFGIAWWPYMLIGSLSLGLMAWRIRRRQRKEEYVLGQDGAPLPKPLHLRKRLRAAAGRVAAGFQNLGSWRPRRVHAMGMALLLTIGFSAYMRDAAAVAEAEPLRPQEAATIAPTSVSGSSVKALEDEDGLVLHYKFNDQRLLVATDVLHNVAVPPGFRATIYVTNIDSSGTYFLSFFDADLPARNLAQDQGSVTETYDNCSDSPVPLMFSAQPYGNHYFTSTESELTVRYYITFELLSQC